MQKFFKIKPVSPSAFNLIVAIWLACGLNTTFFKKILEYSGLHGLEAIWWLFSIITVLLGYYFLVLQLLGWHYTKKIIAILLIVIGGCSAYFVNSMGVVITPEQIQNMIQTDQKEAFNLISTDFLIWLFGFVVLPIFTVIIMPVKKENFVKNLLKKLITSVITLVIAGILVYASFIDFSSVFRSHREIRGMVSPHNSLTAAWSYYKKLSYKPLPLVHYGEDAKRTPQSQQPKLMVLVVGETARAESFSLNGYGRDTNPELSKVPNLINFTQANSCGTATAVSVPCMFSGMPRKDYDSRIAAHREGLLDIAQRAGYKVTWIDNNSGCKGACDRIHQYEIPADIKKTYCDGREYCSDGVLVASLHRYMQSIPKTDNSPQLIVLHQMGSHGPAYYERTEPQYQPFKPICQTNTIQSCEHQTLINTYDNSIVYTDHILTQVIGQLQENQKYQTGFWYLSDHGESTGENGLYLHGAPYAIAPSQQTHIPMMMWFSPKWQNNNSQHQQCLLAQQKQNVGQDNLFPTLLSLLDVKSQVVDSKLDLLSQCGSATSK